MKNIKIFVCAAVITCVLFVIGACEQPIGETVPDDYSDYTDYSENLPELAENEPEPPLALPETEPEQAQAQSESRQIRVFESGNVNVRLFPDGTFIANLYHNTRISGTYTELTQGGETAVLFTHNGITVVENGAASFEATGFETVVGGIADGILTLPEDWDCAHGHNMDFAYRAYPMVFAGENEQKITLYADNTFAADFNGNVLILGFYAIRRTNITFALGSPAFSNSGVPTGIFLLAELTGGEERHDDTEYDDEEHDHGENIMMLTLPGIWAKIAGENIFTLQ